MKHIFDPTWFAVAAVLSLVVVIARDPTFDLKTDRRK
jgi:hypothetical protein